MTRQDLGKHIQFTQKKSILISRAEKQGNSIQRRYLQLIVSNINTPHCEEGFTPVSLKNPSLYIFNSQRFTDLLYIVIKIVNKIPEPHV